jgi:hypothetical protein
MNPIRIAWVPPHGTVERASYRLECWYPHLWLSKHGFESTVLEKFPTPDDRGKYDLMVWFRTDHPEKAFESGIPFVYFLTDGPRPSEAQMEKARWLVTDCDLIVEELGGTFLAKKLTHIPDTFDPPNDEQMRRFRFQKAMTENPKLVWVGSQGGYLWAKEIIDRLRQTWKVEVISDHAEATIPWSRETVFGEIMSCDIGIIPFPNGLEFGDTRGFQPLAKDINRVVLMQAAGLPVIAAPLPAYTKYIRNGVDGMIADGTDEFEACVAVLAQNPEACRTMGNLGWMRAWTTASSPFTGNKWAQLLTRLAR